MNSSDVTPSVCTSATSTNRPTAKPKTAPGSEPASRPTDGDDERREVDADAEDGDLRDGRDLDHDRQEAERGEPQRELVALAEITVRRTCARSPSEPDGPTRICTKSRWRRSAIGATCTCWSLASSSGSAFVTRPIGMFGG